MILLELQLDCLSGHQSYFKLLVMKIPFPFDFSEDKMSFMRRCGYAAFTGPNIGKSSYVKRIAGNNYPRFHVYLGANKDNQEYIDLHLDQKKPSYAGAHAHSGEYEGGAVEIEGNRLSGLIKNEMNNQTQSNQPQPQSQGWFAKFFK